MVVRISSELHRQLLAAAAASPDHEVCGLLFGDDRIDEVVPVANIADDRACTFEIDGTALFAAIRSERAGGARLFGYYHSHPHGPPMPSSRDALQARNDGMVWLIIGDGAVKAWLKTDDHFIEIPIAIND